MRNIIKHIACLTALFCCIIFNSCDSGYDCSLNNTAYNRINFYTTDSYGNEKAYAFPEALTVSMMVNGRDSIVVNHITGTKELTLPVSYTNSCDTVIFSYTSGATDTLYVAHHNIPFYQSMECGIIMHHKLLGVESTSNYFDSLKVNAATINFDYNENIKIYFTE